MMHGGWYIAYTRHGFFTALLVGPVKTVDELQAAYEPAIKLARDEYSTKPGDKPAVIYVRTYQLMPGKFNDKFWLSYAREPY